ncbi:MAG: AI-2E family transporter [Acidobacteriaceae bacterium]
MPKSSPQPPSQPQPPAAPSSALGPLVSSFSAGTFIILALVLAALYFARIVLIPLAIALSLNFLLSPAVAQIERLRIRRIPAVLLVIAMSFALAGGVGWIVTRQVVAVINALPNYRLNIYVKLSSLHAPTTGPLGRTVKSIQEIGTEISAATNPKPPETEPPARTRRERDLQRLEEASKPVPVRVIPAEPTTGEYLQQYARPLLEPIGVLIMILIFTFYILVKHENLRNRLLLLAGRGRINLMTQAMNEAAGRISRYLVMNVMVNATYGVVFGVSLYFLGVPNATLWGALMGILRMVPYAGTLAGGVSAIVFTLAVFPGWWHSLWVVLLFGGLEFLVANFIEPHIYGRRTGISAFALIIMAVIWTLLWGWPGLIVSTPLTVCLIVMGRYIPQLSFLDILLGEDVELSPEAHFYERLLAMDQSEAHEIAVTYLEHHTLLDLYDRVVLPALILSEQDRHKGVLDNVHGKWLYQSVTELVAELTDYQHENRDEEEAKKEAEEKPARAEAEALEGTEDEQPGPVRPVVCIPVEDEVDEIAATMFAQLLEQRGHGTMLLHASALTLEILSRLAEDPDTTVCVSAVPPFAFAQARKLAQSLRDSLPHNPVLVGLWGGNGDRDALRARFGNARPSAVPTTFRAALDQIKELTTAKSKPKSPALT